MRLLSFSLPPTSILLTITASLLLRTLIAFHPHSGQNNHHGSQTAYGGDYEAQRHWMELTIHLPLSSWYKYDVQYWGLDYPPLTAYGSYVLGKVCELVPIVGKESMALGTSRGYEDLRHKAYMRGTVIVLDCLVYIPFCYMIVKRLCGCGGIRGGGIRGGGSSENDGNANGHGGGAALLLLGVLIQPALVIMDHGHFQYNAVCLGLALGSFHFMTKLPLKQYKSISRYSIGWDSIIGSILFCLALNWKQMALYYSPAVFAYLLGRCCSCGSSFTSAVKQVAMLGVTVLTTFAILWLPFYYYRDSDLEESIVEVFAVIVRRIFPFSRGLFEGKVGNLWCVASIKPISIRERIPASIQPICALALTCCMALPFCILLFHMGRSVTAGNINRNADIIVEKTKTSRNIQFRALLWGSAGSSLSFFLASFQVHEKSILLPLAPLSLLMMDQPSTIHWFSIVSMWSVWHLLVVDRLRLAYISLIIIYLCYVYTNGVMNEGRRTLSTTKTPKETFNVWDLRLKGLFTRFVIPLSSFVMVSLHVLEMSITPPPNLPDLFPVLWVIQSCLSFCVMWFMSLWELTKLYLIANPSSLEKEKYEQKKEK